MALNDLGEGKHYTIITNPKNKEGLPEQLNIIDIKDFSNGRIAIYVNLPDNHISDRLKAGLEAETKYVWLKDVPFAKAGDEATVWFSDPNSSKHVQFKSGEKISQIPLDELNHLLVDGWIKKVEPREFWINVYSPEQQLTDQFILHTSESLAKSSKVAKCIETIHVREVTE